VPLLALLFVGVMFVLFSRSQGGIGFLFLVGASGLMIYWVREIRNMSRTEDQRLMMADSDQKDWVYDLIRNEGETVFVAEVPGPEDQIKVKLIEGYLRIRGGQNFTRDVPLELTQDMSISDSKYRNGVLTVRIQKM
jgi:HSP20 family molecular chaperone IbpA